MNNSQRLSQDIIYNVNFSNDFNYDFSNNESNSITDMLINEKFISEENINESNINELNSNEQTNTNSILLLKWYQDKIYIAITRIFLSIVLLISIYIFIQYI
jgi:hypothetical protein